MAVRSCLLLPWIVVVIVVVVPIADPKNRGFAGGVETTSASTLATEADTKTGKTFGDKRTSRKSSKRGKRTLADTVVEEPDPGNVALLASRAGYVVDDRKVLEKAVAALLTTDDLDKRRQMLDRWGFLVDHEEFLRRAEKKFRSDCDGDDVIIRDSRYYRVFSTAGERQTARAQTHMDAIHVKYREIFKFKEKLTDRFILKVFASEAEYHRHAPAGTEFSVAYYSAAERALVCSVPEDDKDFSAFYHEGLHQFLGYYYPNLPHWAHEGLATYFENARLRTSRRRSSGRNFDFKIGEVNAYALVVIKLLVKAGKEEPLPKLLSMDPKRFCSGDPVLHHRGFDRALTESDLHYAQSWALVHFLAHGSSSGMTHLKWYLDRFRRGEDLDTINKGFFKRVNERKLTRAWKRYVEKLEVPREDE